MGLTVKKTQRLLKKGFDKLYDDHITEWQTLLSNAVEFLDNTLPQNARILPDDLQRAISEMVAVHPTFSKYLEEKALVQQYFATDFCDYIIDKKYGREIVKRKDRNK